MMPLIWIRDRNEGSSWIEALEKRLCMASVAQSLVSADFNGDGITDLVVTKVGSRGGLSFLQGNGDGTFQKGVAIGGTGFARGASVATADFNGDGSPDLVVYGGNGLGQMSKTGSPSTRPVNGGLFVLINKGNGTFNSPIRFNNATINAGGKANGRVVAGDFTSDGNADIIVTSTKFSGTAEVPSVGFQGTTLTPTTGIGTGLTGTGGGSVLGTSGTDIFASGVPNALGMTGSTIGPGAFGVGTTGPGGAFANTNTTGGVGTIITPVTVQQDVGFLITGNGDGTFNTAKRISLA